MCNLNNQYNHNKRKKGRSVNTFTINGQSFSIRLTDHAELRLKQRNIDLFQTVGSILSLGEERILSYKDAGKDIMIIDKEKGFSIVAAIEGNTIMIVTVIDKADVFVKSGTTAVNLYRSLIPYCLPK